MLKAEWQNGRSAGWQESQGWRERAMQGQGHGLNL